MKFLSRCIVAASLAAVPLAASQAQQLNLNPGNSAGGHLPIATPTYGSDVPADPALTTGSRYSVQANTPAADNPTIPGATGMSIVTGDRSTIADDRRATTEQKTGGVASDAPGG